MPHYCLALAEFEIPNYDKFQIFKFLCGVYLLYGVWKQVFSVQGLSLEKTRILRENQEKKQKIITQLKTLSSNFQVQVIYKLDTGKMC